MTKSEVKKQSYRECPQCYNRYIESEINRLFQQIYGHESMTDTVYCLKCRETLVQRRGEIRDDQVTKIFERDLNEKTLTEWAQKLFSKTPSKGQF